MSIYTKKTVEATALPVTTFRAEEGYITFFLESDYTAGKLRSQMTPVGRYLFTQGLSINEQVKELPGIQSFGSDTENLTAAATIGSSLTINALYTQEGTNLTWSEPGHPWLMAFVDFIDATPLAKANDVVNSLYELSQTLVLRNLRCIGRSISFSDQNGVNYTMNFNGGKVVRLANNTMDL